MPLEKKCQTCRMANRTNNLNQFECRRDPPSMFLIPVQSLEGQGVSLQPFFPIVTDEQWCDSWKVKIRLTEDES